MGNKLPFREMTLADRAWVVERFRQSDFRGCEYSFGNGFIWRRAYGLEIVDTNGFYVTKSEKSKDMAVYSYPAGNGDLKAAVSALREDAESRGLGFVMRGVVTENTRLLEELFPGEFEFEEVRGDSDYIYSREKLATLAGKKMSKKRNHIARFEDNPNWGYEPITRENIDECFEMTKLWCAGNDDCDKELLDELCAVETAFANYFELGFQGGLLRRDGGVVAYAMGEPLNSDTFVVHIEKAFSDIQGAYAMINKQFALNNCQSYTYINREEDVGSEGLRKAKLSYYPELLLAKHRATLKGSRK